MSLKTIAETGLFVILSCGLSACVATSSAPPPDPHSPYGPPVRVGTLRSPDIDEASGLAASRCQNGVLWTHNDSGGGPFIFAISLTGEDLGTWRVPDVKNIDWEDIAGFKDPAGRCFVYIGEIGDNDRLRPEHAIYRIPEPHISTDTKRVGNRDAPNTAASDTLRFTYPDDNENAETLLVHPVTGDIYVITKRMSGPAGVYKIRPDFGSPEVQKAQLVAEISVPAIPNGLLTGGDISPDGTRMIISDYVAGYEWTLPANAPFDQIWSTPLTTVDIGKRDTGEAVCYSADGRSLFSTSEGDHAPLYQIKLK